MLHLTLICTYIFCHFATIIRVSLQEYYLNITIGQIS